MFGKPKYVYSCPDVLHDQEVAKKNARWSIGLTVLWLGGLIGYGVYAERKENKKPNLEIVPDSAS